MNVFSFELVVRGLLLLVLLSGPAHAVIIVDGTGDDIVANFIEAPDEIFEDRFEDAD